MQDFYVMEIGDLYEYRFLPNSIVSKLYRKIDTGLCKVVIDINVVNFVSYWAKINENNTVIYLIIHLSIFNKPFFFY